MNRALLLIFSLAVALAIAAPATAKGPDQATITGPGLDKPLTFASNGDPARSSPFGTLVEVSGFFPSVFEQTPNPMLAAKPKGQLGPRYEIVYGVPGPDGGYDRIRQDLYPYAAGGPVAYMKPGQPVFDGMRTHGGWYAAPTTVRDELLALGFPKAAPATSASGKRRWQVLLTSLLIGGALAGAVAVRRRH